MNCIYWFVEFVSYFASSNNDSELVESIICPSKVVFSIIHLLFPDTDGHWTQSIINSKVVLVVYNVKNKIFISFIFGLICHIIFFFMFIYNVTLTNTISSLYMLYSLNNKIYIYNLKSPQFLCQPKNNHCILLLILAKHISLFKKMSSLSQYYAISLYNSLICWNL